MAVPNWTSAALASWETTAFNADMPILGVNVIPLSPTVQRWNTEGTISGGDHCHADYPARRAQDGFPHLPTKTDGSAGLDWYFVIDVGTAGVTFDFAALVGCNWATWTPTAVTLELDNTVPNPDGTFTAHEDVGSFGTPSTNDRLADWDLHHTGAVPLRYTDVRYLRLHLVNDATPYTPEISELVLGRRYQLKNRPTNPFSKDGLLREASTTKSKGGLVQKTTYSKGAYPLNAELSVHETTHVTTLRSWFLAHGGSFLWCWNPSSAGNSFHLMSQVNDELSLDNQDWNEQTCRIEAVEQGPERFYLANE